MPLELNPNPGESYFVTRFVGEVTDEQLMQYYGEIYFRENMQPLKPELVDLTEAQMDGVSTKGLAELAKLVESILTDLGVEAIPTAVFSGNDLPYGLARVYQAWSDSSPEYVKVFRHRNEAIEWLTR